jgi:predicted MFS family arabinose efflux permease
MRAAPSQLATVAKLGTSVTIAYASSFYLPAILAPDMAQSLGVAASTVFMAFSGALMVSALLGPFAGRLVDGLGGRVVLPGANGVFATGLVALALAQGPVGLFTAWLLMGVAMAAGFYEASFSTLVRLYGTQSRSAITGITLIAGFASTVGWPLTTWMNAAWGWRGTCLGWAAIQLLVALPLNLWLPNSRAPTVAASASPSAAPAAISSPAARSTAWLLTFVFGVTWFVSTAMAAHLPQLLQASGVELAAAVALAALVGPAQVVGRLLEYSLLRNISPLVAARAASLTHAVGALIFMAVGVPAGVVFTVLHGAGNGVMTIANGTLPLLFFGPNGYGARQGRLMMPARFAQALSPYCFGLAIERWGASALWLSAGLGVLAFLALMALRARH